MIKKIFLELLMIRKELQAIRSSLEFGEFVPEDSNEKHFATDKSKTLSIS